MVILIQVALLKCNYQVDPADAICLNTSLSPATSPKTTER